MRNFVYLNVFFLKPYPHLFSLRLIILLGMLAPCYQMKAQVFPVDYFISPMDTPLYLSAPFGSLRENHFHSGMDIRTYEKTGLPVYAIADGFVSRIKYSSGGYGKALYIDHPNGYTSVYGHLENAKGEIAAYIKKYQYEIRQFDFDHFPGRNRIQVKKGDTIGWSGNSGTSTGPHLHFEIRDTRTEEPINPQLFGIRAADQLAPAIKQVLFYELGANRPLLVKKITLNSNLLLQTDSGQWYTDTILLNIKRLGTAIEAVDYLTDPKKEYSIYGIDLFVNNKQYYGFRLNRFPFDDTRCVNVHIDYPIYKEEGTRFQKLFLDDGNIIPLYTYLKGKGKFTFKDNRPQLLRIRVCDIAGYSQTLYCYIKQETLPLPEQKKGKPTTVFYPKRNNVFQTAQFKIETGNKSLYDTLEFNYQTAPREKGMLSDQHMVHDAATPLHRNIGISIKTDSIPDKLRSKLLVAYDNKNGYIRSAGGEAENGWVNARISNFGTYFVAADTVPPTIRILNAPNNMINDTLSLRIKIDDNLSGICCFKGSINGNWVLFEYDAKNDLLEYFFDENTPKGKLDLELSVWDKKENVTTIKQRLQLK